MFQILVLVPVPLLLLCKISNKYKLKLSNAATNYYTPSWSSSHLNSTTKITKCRQTEWKGTAAEYLLVITQYKLQSSDPPIW